ncbi:MAG: hypothetical protein FD154_1775 [Elusimicrobia bacterium]|nr:MAG: hypothetical protein FD154_1775 [Elusimicrobiota bacterium]
MSHNLRSVFFRVYRLKIFNCSELKYVKVKKRQTQLL